MRAGAMGRAVLATAAGGLGAVLLAGPAAAHVEVSADKPQAGAREVNLTFVGEAESSTAGIASERVVLPEGISPQDVTLVKAPTGWKLTTSADGFTVEGRALPVGEDATFVVQIAQLPPDAGKLAFKTVETYGDGEVVRWIEIPREGAAEPQRPAPTLVVRAAPTPSAAQPTTPAPATTAPATTAPASSSTPSAPADEEEPATRWPLWLGGLAVLAVAAGAVLIWRRRGAAG